MSSVTPWYSGLVLGCFGHDFLAVLGQLVWRGLSELTKDTVPGCLLSFCLHARCMVTVMWVHDVHYLFPLGLFIQTPAIETDNRPLVPIKNCRRWENQECQSCQWVYVRLILLYIDFEQCCHCCVLLVCLSQICGFVPRFWWQDCTPLMTWLYTSHYCPVSKSSFLISSSFSGFCLRLVKR